MEFGLSGMKIHEIVMGYVKWVWVEVDVGSEDVDVSGGNVRVLVVSWEDGPLRSVWMEVIAWRFVGVWVVWVGC